MKQFTSKFLPALAFVAAAGAALSSDAALLPPTGQLKAKINGNWQSISESQPHNCLTSADECTARFNGNQMIPETLVQGTYVSR